MSTTEFIPRIKSSDSFQSTMTTLDPALTATLRPSVDEWYPRLYVGWNYAACVDVFCYFDTTKDEAPEIKWAIHPLGAPFRGKPDLFDFDSTPRLPNIDCSADLKDELKNAVIQTLFAKYQGQERFPEVTPYYNGDEHIEALELWEKNELDIKKRDNVRRIHQAVKAKFDLDINGERIEMLTNIRRFSGSVFKTNDWQQMLCQDSKPAVQPSSVENLKRKSPEGSEDTAIQFPSKKAVAATVKESTPTEYEILKKNLIISQWLRQELDMRVESHLQIIQEFLKTHYKINEEDASFDKIRKMSEIAAPSESPLNTRMFIGLSAAAAPDMIPRLIRPIGSRSRTDSFHERLSATPVRRFSSMTMDDGDLYNAD